MFVKQLDDILYVYNNIQMYNLSWVSFEYLLAFLFIHIYTDCIYTRLQINATFNYMKG